MARREGSHRRIFLHFAIRLATTETLHGYPAGPVKHEAKFQRDFIGDFGYLRFRGFSPATSQEGVEQPARPQELSRAHVLTSSRRRGSHLNIYRIYSMLFDVWYIFAVTVFESLTQTIIRSILYLDRVIVVMSFYIIYHGYHDVL